MALTEVELLSLLARANELRTDIEMARPAIAAVDSSWDDALAHFDDALQALGLAVYLATETLADLDAIEAGDMQRTPDGDVVPAPPDPRQ